MTHSSTTFEIDNVEPARGPGALTSVRSSIERILGGKVESCSTPDDNVINPYGFHALAETFHRAYDEHLPIVLTPDNIWLTISQGFAACVNQDPERYRKCFVSHDGQREIRIRRDSFVMGNPGNNWQGCFPEFSDRIREYIGDETHALIVSDFSTTGDLEKAASEVALMDTMQSYFVYTVDTRCGIPSITLEGTQEDWDSVLNKTKALQQFEGLDWWLNKAIPVVEQFVQAARGDVNLRFWRDIYKGKEGSGGISADGHILLLLPYIKNYNGQTEQNGLVTGSNRYGLSTEKLPQALSCVPFFWDYLGEVYNYQFVAGHVGIAWDEAIGALRPLCGWAVRPQ